MQTSSTLATKTIYVTQSGLPLVIELKWPFHRSTSGADFYVLHTNLQLVNSEDLHAEVSVNLSLVLKDVLPSMEAKDAQGPVINALRKQVDNKQIEFGKSVKLVPMHFSSRHYSQKLKQWTFGKSTDEQITELLLRKAYWSAKAGLPDFWLTDPVEAQYADTTPQHLAETARGLAAKGLLEINGEKAKATQALMSHAEGFENDMRHALKALEEKHAFERG